MGKRLLLALGLVLIPVLAHSATNNFNFSLKNDGDKTVTQGASAFNTITASLVSGTAQAVSFTISGLPQNTTASLSSAMIVGASSVKAKRMRITALLWLSAR